MGSTSNKSSTSVSTPPPSAEEQMAFQQSSATNNLAMEQAGYIWGPSSFQTLDSYDPEAAKQYLAANPDVAASVHLKGDNPTEQQLQGAYQHYLNYGQGEGRKWGIGGSMGWQKRALTAEEQQQADRDKQINDQIYAKLTGQISPEDKALVDTAYNEAKAVGTSDLNAEFARSNEQLNMAATESAAARGLNAGDTPISGPVAYNQRLLGEDQARNLRNFNTGIEGARAGAMLDVGYRQQLFGQALREFQANLESQRFSNQQNIANSFGNMGLGLGSLRSRNLTQITKGNTGQSSSSILGGAGGLMQGIGSMWSAFGSSSSREFKENIEPVNVDIALAEVENMPVYTWSYKPEFGEQGQKHIGPVTEESPSIMVTPDGKHLSSIDCLGMLFAAVKSLNEKVKKLEKET